MWNGRWFALYLSLALSVQGTAFQNSDGPTPVRPIVTGSAPPAETVLVRRPQGSGSDARTLTPEQWTADFDAFWSGLRDGYAYFDRKETDWNKVRDLYRPWVAEVRNRSDFVALLELVLAELYDHHTNLNTNLRSSPRLVPAGADIWPEWVASRPVITQLRSGFSAEQAGLKVGMEIVSIDGDPIGPAVARRLPKCLRRPDPVSLGWALRVVMAGTHDRPRRIELKPLGGEAAVYRLDLPTHTTVDSFRSVPRVEWKMLPGRVGYIRINDLIANEIVAQFDAALEGVRASRGLILDLRDIPAGGNTDVAEPILGRFITRHQGYQKVVPLGEPAYIKQVSPTGRWSYRAPMVVLVNRWTASMAEGMAIGLDGMKRATVVGTRMAGLNGGIFSLKLPNSGIGVNYAGERLNHVNGTPREQFVPPVLVDLRLRGLPGGHDAVLESGLKEVHRLTEFGRKR